MKTLKLPLLKKCLKCKKLKETIRFNIRVQSNDGYNTRCKQCISDYKREYQKANKEKLSLKKKEYYKINKKHINRNSKQYEENNKQKQQAYRKIYREENKHHIKKELKKYYCENKNKLNKNAIIYRNANKEKLALSVKRYRESEHGKAVMRLNSLKRRASGSLSTRELSKLIKDSDNKCFYCRQDIPSGKLHIDHYMPIKLGGKTTLSNLRVSCANCNLRKGCKHPSKFEFKEIY